MIWLRRILTIPLILIFVIIFVAVLLVTQFSGMVGNPQFYNNQLSKADTYNWIYDKLMPAVLDEMEQEHPTDLPVGIEARDEVIAAMKKTVNIKEHYNTERLRPHYRSFEMKPLFIMTSEG